MKTLAKFVSMDTYFHEILLLTIHTKIFDNEPSKLIYTSFSCQQGKRKLKKSQFIELNVHKTLIIIKS